MMKFSKLNKSTLRKNKWVLYVVAGCFILTIVTIIVVDNPFNKPEDEELEEVKEKANVIKESLSGIAPPPPKVDVTAAEGPQYRLKQLNLPEPPQKKAKVILPKNKSIDVQNPRGYSKPLALPAVPKEAPDPFTEPPMEVNPERVKQPDVERQSLGTYK